MGWIIVGSVLGGFILVTLIITLAIDIYMVNAFVNPKRYTRAEHYEVLGHKNMPEFACLEEKPFSLTMRDGYVINGDVSLNGNSKKFMIVCHGHASTREGATRYCYMYYQMGYSVVRYDHRGHGDNKRVLCTMGANEAKDLKEVIDYIRKTYGEGISISLHGTSMGGATVLLLTQYDQNIKFIVADCPYSSIKNFASDFVKKHHVPKWLFLPVFELLLKIYTKHSINEMAPELVLKDNKVPTLFMHGLKDTTIPPYHHDIIYAANGGEKEERLFPHGTHANSVFDDPEEYLEVVTDYVRRHE